MADITDSLFLTSPIFPSMEFSSWLNSMHTIAHQLIIGDAADGFDPRILDILVDGIWITDKNDVIIYANHAVSNIIGIPQEKILGTRLRQDVQGSAFQHFLPYYTQAKDRGRPIQYEPLPVVTPAGQFRHQTGWLIPRYNNTHFKGIICSVSDVTGLKQLAFSEAKWQTLCACSPDAIMLINLDGHILFSNNSLPRFFQTDTVGDNFLEAIPEQQRKEVADCLKRVRQTGKLDRCTIEYMMKEGDVEYFECRVGPVLQNGEVVAHIVNTSNITRQKMLEKEVKKHLASIEETNITLKVLLKRIEKERLLFQENISTNILCNIEPYMNKIRQTPLDKDQKRTLNILDQNIKDMASPLVYSVMSMNLRLTPAEMQISNFIRQGYSSKEIAELLNISPATIDKHRKNIRKKLGITNKKQNLRSVLSSIST